MRERKGRIKRWRQSIVVENEIRLCREIKRNVTAFPVGGTARGLPCTREGSHLLHDLREFRAELVEGPLLLEVLAALAPIVRAAVVLLTPFPAVVVGPQSPRRRHAPRGPPPRDDGFARPLASPPGRGKHHASGHARPLAVHDAPQPPVVVPPDRPHRTAGVQETRVRPAQRDVHDGLTCHRGVRLARLGARKGHLGRPLLVRLVLAHAEPSVLASTPGEARAGAAESRAVPPPGGDGDDVGVAERLDQARRVPVSRPSDAELTVVALAPGVDAPRSRQRQNVEHPRGERLDFFLLRREQTGKRDEHRRARVFALRPGARAPLEDPPGFGFEREGIHAAARDLFKSPNFLFRRKRDARDERRPRVSRRARRRERRPGRTRSRPTPTRCRRRRARRRAILLSSPTQTS